MSVKVLISVDMEGVSGVVHADHTGRDGKDYDIGRRLMTLEANAAIEGAIEAGADEVVVNDSHGTQRNLLPELLDQRAQLITGSPKPQTMMAGLDATFDAALCVGYHARAGSQGILDHTISGRVVHEILVNGQPQGELGLNAGIAAHHGVPIVMVAGDTACCEQARELIPGIEAAEVKSSPDQVRSKGAIARDGASPNQGEGAPRRGASRRDCSRRLLKAGDAYAAIRQFGHGRRGGVGARRGAFRCPDGCLYVRQLPGGVSVPAGDYPCCGRGRLRRHGAESCSASAAGSVAGIMHT